MTDSADTPTVVIGCRLPNGITMEVGTPGKESYRAVHCKGCDGRGYGRTVGVPKVIADAWFRANAKLRYVVDGSVFVVKS